MALTVNKSKLATLLKILLIVVVIMESSGLISLHLGLDGDLSRMLFAAFLAAAFIFSFYLVITNKRKGESIEFYYPFIAFFAVFLVSMVSGTFLFPKPIAHWLPALYVFLPIFSFYFLYLIKATPEDLSISFIIIALFVTTLIIADKISRIDLLDNYTRLSIFDASSRRIVLLKNEVIFGIMILVSLLLSTKLKVSKALPLFCIIALCIFFQVQTMESRLGIVAFIVAFLAMMHFNKRQKKIGIILFLACAFGLFFIPIWIIQNSDALAKAFSLEDTGNISIRIDSVVFLLGLFYKSYGLGVGMMSPTGHINNILHSNPLINYYDGGVFASIAQFGVIGLYVWYKFTSYSISSLSQAAKDEHSKNRYISIAVTGFILGFTITALPLNLFLQPWTMFVGGVILYLVWVFTNHNKQQRSIT